jgi:hypothetical protein
MNQELVINTNKNFYKKLCNTGFTWLAIMLFLLFYTLKSHSTSYPFLAFKWSLLIIIVCIIIYLIYCSYRILRKAPMAIINPQGIWIQQFGIIPWNNILKLERPTIMGVAVEALGIHIRDTKALSKQATLAGKLIILESKYLKTPTIVLDNIELNYDTIAGFARQFTENV